MTTFFKINLFLLGLVFHCSCVAYHKPLVTVDIYGTKTLTSSQISAEYHEAIADIANTLRHGSIANSPLDRDTFAAATQQLTEGIKAKSNYAYVGISPIIYPNDPITHITIDVVEAADKHRLAYFNPKPNGNIPDPQHLVAKMLAYQKEGFAIIFNTKQFPTFKTCPAHHCLFGFEHPSLKKYQHSFNTAEQYKTILAEIIRRDKDENKRAAAVFVLAHIKNYHELIKILLPTIHDANAEVRNNALRVLGVIASQHKDADIPPQEIINALDFPSTTDRNKALFILSSLANKPHHANYIIQHAAPYLINTLKLHQPNNHVFSYQILKKISHKNYTDRDYTAWSTWLMRANNANAIS